MSKLENEGRNRKHSKKGKRFYTSRDMAIVKHDIAADNGRVKRGEKERHNNQKIVVCGCGAEGCFLHISHESEPKKD